MKNQLFYGDNLTVLRDLPDEHVDLIYLDPPFNSKRNYNIIFETAKHEESIDQKQAFSDTWSNINVSDTLFEIAQKHERLDQYLNTLHDIQLDNSTVGYLATMAVRLIEMHRILKPTGSLYLHCDTTMSHYLKTVLDLIFGKQNFRNEIIWQRTSVHNDAKQGARHFGRVHDSILFYSKSLKHQKFKMVYTDYSPEYIESTYHKSEPNGRKFKTSDLSAAKPGGETSYRWKGQSPPQGRYWAYSKENMEQFEKEGRIYYSSSGKPYLKQYLDEMPGVAVQDIWTDIKPLGSTNESLGYPTQKPLSLLERIIKASSNEGDMVLDPFCGCGTALDAAEGLKRSWIGIDITPLAISLIERRLKDRYGENLSPYEVHGFPSSIEGGKKLAHDNKFEFQDWVIEYLMGGVSNPQKVGDGGYDGYSVFRHHKDTIKVLYEVKGGAITKPMLTYFMNAMEHAKAGVGIFITLEKPTSGMIEYANAQGYFLPEIYGNKFHRFQIMTVEDLLNGVKPNIPIGNLQVNHVKSAKRTKTKSDQGSIF